MKIPFNRVHTTGEELSFIGEVIRSGEMAGDGIFHRNCQAFFDERFGFRNTWLTNSCTGALEMAALLLDIRPGDEVIAPSFSYVSTVNPFVLRGAKIVFADSSAFDPNIDADTLEALFTQKTRAVVVVHYGGTVCAIEKITALARKKGVPVVEDAAHALDATRNGAFAGTMGAFAAFSFHSTKNITCGEGGLLVINDPQYVERADILFEKGTNRKKFLEGAVDNYEWVDVGSSFSLSELQAAFLYAQLRQLNVIQAKRKTLWRLYYDLLLPLGERGISCSPVDPRGESNAHIFFLVCSSIDERRALSRFLAEQGIASASHYGALHQSRFFASLHDGRPLTEAVRYAERLLRLPMHYSLEPKEAEAIAAQVCRFYQR